MSTGFHLNGSTALAEAIKQQLGNVRRDWRVEAAEHRARVSESLLEVERVCAAARARIAEVQDGLPGRNGIDGAPGERGESGAPGERGEHGLQGERGDPGPAGERGEHGLQGLQGAQGERGEAGERGAPGEQGLPGERGTDGARGLQGERGEQGEQGERGEPGQPGEVGSPGERGECGPPGTFAAPIPYKAGQITYAGKLTYHEGSTFCALRDTAAAPPHVDFQPVAYRGRDAYGGRALGLYDEKRTDYRAMDVVALNGSEWRATRDDPGPCPGESGGWVLGAKGAKGKPGEPGQPGAQGPAGPPGIGLAHVEQIGRTLLFTRTDGSALTLELDVEALIG